VHFAVLLYKIAVFTTSPLALPFKASLYRKEDAKKIMDGDAFPVFSFLAL